MNNNNFNNIIGLDSYKLYIQGTIKKTAILDKTLGYLIHNDEAKNKGFITDAGILPAYQVRHKEASKYQINFVDAGSLTIKASIPKIIGKPYNVLDTEANKQAYDYLLDEVSEFYSFNKRDVKNSRIDICRNIELDNNFEAYNSFLCSIPNKFKGYNFQNTYTAFNGSMSHCIYDKGKEALDTLKDKTQIEAVKNIFENKNIIRNEIRLLKGQKLKQLSNTIGINLLEPEALFNKEKFKKLQDYYLKHNKNFFRYMLEALDTEVMAHSQRIYELYNIAGSMPEALKRIGIGKVSLDVIGKFIREKQGRDAEAKFKKRFIEAEAKYFSNINNNKLNCKSLLYELKTKTLLKVA